MQNIILITREKAERVIAVSVFLCNRIVEVSFFCDFINRLSLADGEKMFARRVLMGREKDEGEDSGELWREYEEEKNHAVLTFTGIAGICKKAAVMLFDSEKSAFHYCETMNNLHAAGDVFVYARRAEQMVEYETEEPLLTRFDYTGAFGCLGLSSAFYSQVTFYK